MDAGLVPSQQSLPFTRAGRAERKERFVRHELAGFLPAFPWGWLCTVTDSITSRQGARGGTDTSGAGVGPAAFYYLKIMQLAPHQGQRCCKALAYSFQKLLVLVPLLLLTARSSGRGGFALNDFGAGLWD